MSVYTLINHSELEAFLAEYQQGDLVSFEGISAGIENTNYFVDTSAGRFVLTIFEHHSFEELPYFLNIMAFMADHKIPTAHPKPNHKGAYLTELKGKPAALVERLVGSGVENPTQKQCEVMSEHLAKFHVAGQTFNGFRPNDRDLSWAQATYEVIRSHLPTDEQFLIESEISFQSQVDWSDLPKSVIHADLFCDNALFNGDELSGIIDLYYACNGAMLYDLAVMVNEWCRMPDLTLCPQKLQAAMVAYQAVRPLTLDEEAAWQAALRMGALRFFLSRLKDKHLPREGELTQIKDPNVFKTVLINHRATV
ncbi:homoserine kinase [Thiosulfativibrio zosterae]|uniref:Homoserine kinase n=1 Tax=Thiosulfativibrio zosterae TaxID=2675053 RepID=A0A6F8PJK5_9GAMM|nr:homoserine kinase [Thiosulfativibrio zosterae]BBP42279.1 homoserine kinase [Thiosulfativibrio zosterae]